MRAAIALFPIRPDYEADVTTLLRQRAHEPGSTGTFQAKLAPMRHAKTSGHLAYSGPQPVGVIVLTAGFEAASRGDFGVISELYVADWCRNAGVGSALLQAAEAECRAYGYRALDMKIPASDPFCVFLERSGFQRFGLRMVKTLNDRRPTGGPSTGGPSTDRPARD